VSEIQVPDWRRPAETILGECWRCRLPVYQSDPHRMVSIPSDAPPELFHSGCAMAQEGEGLEGAIQKIAQKLRGCGYIVEVRIVRPVR
jgi:hypothetical protein